MLILLPVNYFPSHTVNCTLEFPSFFFFLKKRCVCLLFLAVLGLTCYTQAFSAWVSGGAVCRGAWPSHPGGFSVTERGPSARGLQ